MSADRNTLGEAQRGLLPEGRMTGPMPWVIAIMMLLTVLAAAVGLGLGRTAKALEGGNRITVQIVEADPARRESQARSAFRSLQGLRGVKSVELVETEDMRLLLEPWIGQTGPEADLPVPALIDVELSEGAEPPIEAIVMAVAPSARIDDHAGSLVPLGKLVAALRWLAAGLLLLMAGATGATVVLASRAALDTHRPTIEVLHLMGATDVQLARLFQRRIALDALFGGVLGFVGALFIIWLVGERVSALGSELAGSAGLTPAGWALLASLPLAGVLLAMTVARWTVMRALRRLP